MPLNYVLEVLFRISLKSIWRSVDGYGTSKNVWDLIVTTIIEVDFRTFGVLWLAGSGYRSWTIKEDSSQFHFSSIYSTQRLEVFFLLMLKSISHFVKKIREQISFGPERKRRTEFA